ncbi:hypothetical protein DM860_017214 [Cuscuta australis]|uniref:Uncharacterized protein n=1 Tax=Cuscuta australis TaxID=267555 RepID=A0A328E4T5_9ASTE|nr:hypothetical protein DM860_017214 [Cuscuta australis]
MSISTRFLSALRDGEGETPQIEMVGTARRRRGRRDAEGETPILEMAGSLRTA